MGQQWHCMKSGDCCRRIGAVAMMPAERDELLAASDVPMTFVDLADGLVALQPRPGSRACPLLSAEGQCSVYAVRPYNCRCFGCFRPTTDEPLEVAVTVDESMGDLKPVRLYTSRPVARQWRRMQAHAQPWALAHGWVPLEETS